MATKKPLAGLLNPLAEASGRTAAGQMGSASRSPTCSAVANWYPSASSRGVCIRLRVAQLSRPTVTASRATRGQGNPVHQDANWEAAFPARGGESGEPLEHPTGQRRCSPSRAQPRTACPHRRPCPRSRRWPPRRAMECSRARARAPARPNSSAPVMITPIDASVLSSAAVSTASSPDPLSRAPGDEPESRPAGEQEAAPAAPMRPTPVSAAAGTAPPSSRTTATDARPPSAMAVTHTVHRRPAID